MNNKHSTSTDCSYEYTVRRGDSFYLIAHRLGVPLRDLLEANSSINPARLMVGDVLCIPTVGRENAAKPESSSGTQASGKNAVSPAPTDSSSADTGCAAPDDKPAKDEPEAAACPLPASQEEAAPDAVNEPADLLDRPAAELRSTTAPESASAPGSATAPASRATPEPTGSQDASSAPAVISAPVPVTDPTASCAVGTAHAVSQGETLADIQLASGLNLHTLAAANPGTDLDALTAGQVLCVPAENIPCPIIPTYTLRRDDTLETAALRLNLSIGALLRANPCMAPADFRPGAIICLPEA